MAITLLILNQEVDTKKYKTIFFAGSFKINDPRYGDLK